MASLPATTVPPKEGEAVSVKVEVGKSSPPNYSDQWKALYPQKTPPISPSLKQTSIVSMFQRPTTANISPLPIPMDKKEVQGAKKDTDEDEEEESSDDDDGDDDDDEESGSSFIEDDIGLQEEFDAEHKKKESEHMKRSRKLAEKMFEDKAGCTSDEGEEDEEEDDDGEPDTKKQALKNLKKATEASKTLTLNVQQVKATEQQQQQQQQQPMTIAKEPTKSKDKKKSEHKKKKSKDTKKEVRGKIANSTVVESTASESTSASTSESESSSSTSASESEAKKKKKKKRHADDTSKGSEKKKSRKDERNADEEAIKHVKNCKKALKKLKHSMDAVLCGISSAIPYLEQRLQQAQEYDEKRENDRQRRRRHYKKTQMQKKDTTLIKPDN